MKKNTEKVNYAELRNLRKAKAKEIQGKPMDVTTEENLQRKEAGLKEIKPKLWKITPKPQTPKRKVMSQQWLDKHLYNLSLGKTRYVKPTISGNLGQFAELARIERKRRLTQSKEDKAKYNASLAKFKETYTRKTSEQKQNVLDHKKRHKKNRGSARKSTKPIYMHANTNVSVAA